MMHYKSKIEVAQAGEMVRILIHCTDSVKANKLKKEFKPWLIEYWRASRLADSKRLQALADVVKAIVENKTDPTELGRTIEEVTESIMKAFKNFLEEQ